MCKLLSIWLGYFVCLLSDGLVWASSFLTRKIFPLERPSWNLPSLSAVCHGLAGWVPFPIPLRWSFPWTSRCAVGYFHTDGRESSPSHVLCL